METKRLIHSKEFPLQELSSKEPLVEIEVPAGESHYHLLPSSFQQHFVFHLRHPHCQTLITGLVEVKNEEKPDLTTEVIHHAPHSKAETLIRTLVYEEGSPRYQGLIKIEKEAPGCESYLNHHSLLLGEKAKSWSIPSLEILTDQVKCSHAATIRTLTELDLFYLRSRGISATSARQLLIEAFLADILAQKNDPS